jgi:shikimate dehydrogenase
MHNAAFAALGLDWRYVPLPVDPQRPDAVRRAVSGLAALGMAGANVTVPHKQAVMPFVDRLLPAAQAIGAVNTLVVEPDGSLQGDNTDAGGFVPATWPRTASRWRGGACSCWARAARRGRWPMGWRGGGAAH